MATTVSYKNNTLTTVNNSTHTLKTAGKYLEDDITLTDVTGSISQPSVSQDENGYLVLDDDSSSITIESLVATQNGIYTASSGKAYSPVTVAVTISNGTFTPASNTKTYDLTVGLNNIQYISWWLSPTSTSALNNSVRVDYGKTYVFNDGVLSRIMGVYSNAGGTSWTGVYTTGSDQSSYSNGVLTITGNYLIAGCTYNWIAW